MVAGMEWLNYHHLLYFWMVAKEGSVVRASEVLHLAHPTISGQIHRLEAVLGEKLFARRGRQLALTEAGRVAFRYADEIFSLGREFVDTLKGRASGRPLRFSVGVADVLPPSLVRRFLEPAFRMGHPVQVTCRADKSVEEFVADLALPFLMPGPRSAVRRALEQWFEAQSVRPVVIAEFDDSALAKDFGKAGMGIFAAPTVIENEVVQQYRVRIVGRANAVRQHFYAISVERKIKHPAVIAIREAARQKVFTAA